MTKRVSWRRVVALAVGAVLATTGLFAHELVLGVAGWYERDKLWDPAREVWACIDFSPATPATEPGKAGGHDWLLGKSSPYSLSGSFHLPLEVDPQAYQEEIRRQAAACGTRTAQAAPGRVPTAEECENPTYRYSFEDRSKPPRPHSGCHIRETHRLVLVSIYPPARGERR